MEGSLEYSVDLPSDYYYDYQSYSSNESFPENITGLPTWEIVVKTGFYIPVILMSLLGNGTIILVVANNKRMQVSGLISQICERFRSLFSTFWLAELNMTKFVSEMSQICRLSCQSDLLWAKM